MSRRYARWEAQALLEHYVEAALGTTASTLQSAVSQAEATLNRAARRALGARSDGRYSLVASLMIIPRG